MYRWLSSFVKSGASPKSEPLPSDERQTVGATKPQSSATMSLAGPMDETSSLWTLVSIALPRSVRVSDCSSLPADPMLGEPAADPEEKHGPASDKNWSC